MWLLLHLLILEMRQEIFCWGSFLSSFLSPEKCFLCLSHWAGCTQLMCYCGEGVWPSGNLQNLGSLGCLKYEITLEGILVAGIQELKLLELNFAKSGMNWVNEGRRLLHQKVAWGAPEHGCRYWRRWSLLTKSCSESLVSVSGFCEVILVCVKNPEEGCCVTLPDSLGRENNLALPLQVLGEKPGKLSVPGFLSSCSFICRAAPETI